MAKAYRYALLFSSSFVIECFRRMDTSTSTKSALSDIYFQYFIRTMEKRLKRHFEAVWEPFTSPVQLLGLMNALDWMASLFSKKRSQFVAVWFTESIDHYVWRTPSAPNKVRRVSTSVFFVSPLSFIVARCVRKTKWAGNVDVCV